MNARVLSLAKGKHRYVFRYAAGNESQVIDAILAMADDSRAGLDWLDAATLGFQVAHYTAVNASDAAGASPGGAPAPRPGRAFGGHAMDG